MRNAPLNELAGGLILLAIAGLYYAAISDIADSTLSDEVGAAGLPRILAILLAAFGLILAMRAVHAMRLQSGAGDITAPAEVAAAGAEESDPVSTLPRALTFLCFGAAYVALLPVIGYLPAITLLIAAVAIFEGARPGWRTAVIALGGAVLYWAIFVKLLGVRQPSGWFF